MPEFILFIDNEINNLCYQIWVSYVAEWQTVKIKNVSLLKDFIKYFYCCEV